MYTASAWAQAWNISLEAFGYTNHTLLPEALETWPVPLIERMLPRHMQIIYAINARAATRAVAADSEQISRISMIDEDSERRVRMGNLAFVGSHSINGVSALHTELMKKTVFATCTSSTRAHQQQDQRHNAAALADVVQSGPDELAREESATRSWKTRKR